ncbi:MAG TPA: ACT domain-containing protein [Armatimonadota bacterium]|nr:ACT domain-containing protein [Armatimonadota bacterium]
MPLIAVTAVGQDRPGIVAEFSGALFRLGCNLEETTMTRLRDQFAMLLLVRLPDAASPEELDRALQAAGSRLGLSVGIRPLPGSPAGDAPEASGYILRLYGADRPGIVHAATALLAERGFNITDLNTRVIPGAGGPVYVMLLEVDAPSAEAAEALRPELERLRRELGVDLSFSALEQEAL